MGGWKQHKQLVRTTFRRVRANLPAQRESAVGFDRGREGCFYSCSGCFQSELAA